MFRHRGQGLQIIREARVTAAGEISAFCSSSELPRQICCEVTLHPLKYEEGVTSVKHYVSRRWCLIIVPLTHRSDVDGFHR